MNPVGAKARDDNGVRGAQRVERASTSISSAIFRRCSAALPLTMACSTQWRDVVAQHLLLDAPQRRADGGDLRDDVDAVAVLLDHAGEAAHLALDAAQALQAGGLGCFAHA